MKFSELFEQIMNKSANEQSLIEGSISELDIELQDLIEKLEGKSNLSTTEKADLKFIKDISKDAYSNMSAGDFTKLQQTLKRY